MSTSIFFNQAILYSSLKRFKEECKSQEAKLLSGQCQLCIDGLFLLVPSSNTNTISHVANVIVEDDDELITPNPKCSLESNGDEYLLQLIRKCPYIKIVYPPNRPFRGYIDLSLFECCKALELIRIPFNRITGEELLRQNLRSLIWIRGNQETMNESINWSIYRDNNNDSSDNNFKPLRIDEIFWDDFGSWSSLNYLCLARSNITLMNASTMPSSIQTLDLRNNRICHFNNLANYSWTNSITKLCLEYNSLKELPKLNANTLSSLVYLSLRGNLLESINGLRNFNSLDYLDLSENSIIDSRHFLSEIVFLSSTLKTLFIEKNPIMCDRNIQLKCEDILCRLINFNGKKIKRKIKVNYNRLVPNIISPIQPAEPSSINMFSDSSIEAIEDEHSKLEKIKQSKERFVVIDDDELERNNPDDDSLQQFFSTIPTSVSKLKKEETKNYLFGGISGSYGSSVNNLSQLKNVNNETKVIENFETNQTTNDNEDDIATAIFIHPIVEDNTPEMEFKNQSDNSNDGNQQQQQQPKKEIEASEWAMEDTEENTMFLVEIYSNMTEYEENLNQQESSNDIDYYFVRVRPRDGLIFEKDCTSGKILQTLDLKILQRYETLANNEDNNNFALKLYFDTCIVAKKERIYRFLDEKSFNNFIEMFLSKHTEYRQQYMESTNDSHPQKSLSQNDFLSSNQNSSSNNSNNRFTSLWFYMCLRCGHRTHRIITDCDKCGSELIIRDENFQNNQDSQSKILTNLDLKPTVDDQAQHNTNNDEETIDDFDLTNLDENFFRSNIDHYLKLHIEIYLYERLSIDEKLKSESVEALFHCLIYDSGKKSFQPCLAVLTNNYFFLFDHLISSSVQKKDEEIKISPKKSSLYGSSAKDNDKKDLISLIFYTPLASEQSPPLIISHLPKPMKNIGYWLELKLNNSLKKILSNLKNKRKQQKFILELILFADETMGKAFLEMLFKFQKICLRSQSTTTNVNQNDSQIHGDSNNLIIVKSSITKLIDGGDDEENDHQMRLEFDEFCQSILKNQTLDDSSCDEGNNTTTTNKSYSIFILESFQYLQNLNQTLTKSNSSSLSFNNLFIINDNIILIMAKDYLIIGELYCLFKKICSTFKSNPNQPMAKILLDGSSSNDFDDHIEIKTLFKELIINLLPNIYLDKANLMLVLRFREDDDFHSHSHTSSSIGGGEYKKGSIKNQKLFSIETPEQNSQSNLSIYEFKLKFLSLTSLLKTCQMICDSWEKNFGISLTLSKYHQDINENDN